MQNSKGTLGAASAWWALWSSLHIYALLGLGLSLEYAIYDSLIANAFLVLSTTALSFSLRYYLPSLQKIWQLLILVVLASLAAYFFTSFCLSLLAEKQNSYAQFLKLSKEVRFLVIFLLNCTASVLFWILQLLKNRFEAREIESKTAQLAKETELISLREQLHPHFLFNTLNSISALMLIDTQKARVMLHQLSDFLRGTLNKSDLGLLNFGDELAQIQLYIEIEKVRFGNRLLAQITCCEACREAKIPSFILQPLVENAIKFGLYDTLDAVEITIETELVNQQLQICISNPYDSETAHAQKGVGFGLQAIQRRLFLLYNNPNLLTITKSAQRFTVSLTIPQV